MKNMAIVKVREKGQITLPSELRAALQIKKGSELIAKSIGNELILIPKLKNPIEKFGFLGKEKNFTTVKDLIWKYEQGQK